MFDMEVNYFMFVFIILLNIYCFLYLLSYYGDFYLIIIDFSYLCMCVVVFYDKGLILSLFNC